jgi:uncharacterized protein (DUF362 family)
MTEVVAVGFTEPYYNNEPPFHPDTHYPELRFGIISSNPNNPYNLIRDLFFRLGYDANNYGSKGWNPLGTIIKPGNTVVIKPNFVMHFNSSGDSLFSVVTHPSIIRALIDYIFIALNGSGRIIIADAPQMDCDWDQLMCFQQLDAIQSFYHSQFNFNIEIYDLRNFFLVDTKHQGYSWNRKKLQGDPLGSVVINLGRFSKFYGYPSENYYGADYDRSETIKHHQGEIHEYEISRTILSADVLVSVPKMKVHKKVGVTLNLKGLVGINVNKNYLIHYRVGAPKSGGDQLPNGIPIADQLVIKIQRFFFDKALAKQNRSGDFIYKVVSSFYKKLIKPLSDVSLPTAIQDAGNWYGNDSAWRMTSDLAKIIYFYDAKGKLHRGHQRKLFCLVDGIIGGENNGPLSPNAKHAGCIVAGINPIAVDLVATRLMGFDIKKIKQFSLLNDQAEFVLDLKSEYDIDVLSDIEDIRQMFTKRSHYFGFKPHPGWVGHIEI